MNKADSFIFSSYETDWSTGTISFLYEVKIDDSHSEKFVEKWSYGKEIDVSDIPARSLQGALQALHLVVGVSYFKMYLPKSIEIPTYSLTKKQANFWNSMFTHGLGEFFYKNNIDFHGLIDFPASAEDGSAMPEVGIIDKALVLHGGGKDSIVTAQALRSSDIDFDLFSLYPQSIHKDVAGVMGKDILAIDRQVDPRMLELNSQGHVYNGHIPISAIYSYGAALTALLFGYTYVVISSERSSDYGNVEYLGKTINHQWSKSAESEHLIQQYIEEHISPSIRYFSMLRPLYEISVAKKFTEYPQYFEHFSSSNHNFKLDESGKKTRWDYMSPKTLFVFVLLAAFLSKEQMIQIFGKDLYEDESVLDQLEALLGVRDVKPFECVGTPEETKVAMWKAYEKGEYSDSPAMHMFKEKILSQEIDWPKLETEVFSYGDDTAIPEKFRLLV